MNHRELKKLENDSIHSIEMNNDLKDTAINSHLNDLNRVIKSNLRKNKILVLVLDVS